jgi:hypothetical protein
MMPLYPVLLASQDVEFSDDGSHMAYSLSSGGSDWAWIQVGLGEAAA